MKIMKAPHRFVMLAAALALAAGSVYAQTKIKPGFNLFSVDQDIEIGRQSAAEVERQLPILQDRDIDRYVTAIGKRLAATASGPKFPFTFKVVNAADINAFALPGGFMYLNRGLIEAARTEGQLAGVMAHEMSHVLLRHGTNQASKAYLGQAGLGVMGGLLGGKNSSTSRTIGAVGGFGLNVLFLKFSRTDEKQADIFGAQMMARAGYDPKEMADFFEILRKERSKDPSRLEQFFSDHPAPSDRAAYISAERKKLTINPKPPVGGLTTTQARLRNLPKAPTMQQIAQNAKTSGGTSKLATPAGSSDIMIDRPASTFAKFEQRQGFFQIDYPQNWRVYEPTNGYGVTIAPESGFVDNGGQERVLIYGVVINHYDPFETGEDDDRFGNRGSGFLEGGGSARIQSRTALAEATRDIVNQVIRANPYLKMAKDSARTDTIDSSPSLSVVLSGRSPVTQEEERVTVFTRELPDDHTVYAVFVAPGKDYPALRPTFEHMISSLRINDEASHR